LAANIWSGDTNDAADVTHWSLGWVPKAGDTMRFDATSVVNCTLVAGITCDGIVMTSGYTGTVSCGTSLTHVIGTGGIVLDGTSATWNWGTSCVISDAGALDTGHMGTVTAGTTTIVTVTGTANIIGTSGAQTDVPNLVIGATANVTVTVSLRVGTSLTNNGGTITVATTRLLWMNTGCTVVVNSGTIAPAGTGYWLFASPESGKGLTTFTAGTISIPITFRGANAAAVLAPGTYSGLVTIKNNTTTSGTWTPSAGTYTFAGGLTILCDNAAATTTVNLSANNPTFIIQGNLTTTVTAGTVTITKSTSVPMQVTGTAALTLNLAGKDFGTWIFTKSAGAITFTSGDTITAGGNWTLPSLTEPAGVSIDFGDGAYTHAIAGDCICDGTALDWGTGNAISIAGTLDVQHVGTVTVGTSVVTMTGTGNLLGQGFTDIVSQLTIGALANVTVTANVSIDQTGGTLTVNGGTLTIATGVYLYVSQHANCVLNSGTVASAGTAQLQFLYTQSGHGLVTLAAGVVLSATVRIRSAYAGSVFAPGVFSGLVQVDNASTYSCTFTPSAGTYTFASGLIIICDDAAATVTLAASNATTFNVTALTMTNSAAGSLVVTAAGNPNWNITGNVVFTNSGGGTFTWTKGTGTITFTSTSTITSIGKNLEAIVVNTAGTVTLGGALTCTHLTLTAGTFNPATYAVNTGNFSLAAVAVLTPAGLVAATWTVTGTFTAIGDIGPASGAWTLNVTGASTARSGTVTRVNASGGALLDARGCVDGGNNVNVMFGRAAKVFRSSILSGAVLAA
jgi:hypothetical protein